MCIYILIVHGISYTRSAVENVTYQLHTHEVKLTFNTLQQIILQGDMCNRVGLTSIALHNPCEERLVVALISIE